MILMVRTRFHVKWIIGTILRTPDISSRRLLMHRWRPTLILMDCIYNNPSSGQASLPQYWGRPKYVYGDNELVCKHTIKQTQPWDGLVSAVSAHVHKVFLNYFESCSIDISPRTSWTDGQSVDQRSMLCCCTPSERRTNKSLAAGQYTILGSAFSLKGMCFGHGFWPHQSFITIYYICRSKWEHWGCYKCGMTLYYNLVPITSCSYSSLGIRLQLRACSVPKQGAWPQ